MDKEETKNQTENDGIWEYKVIHININIEKRISKQIRQ